MTHWLEGHSRTNIDHLEQLFISAILRNQLTFLKRSQLIPFCSNLRIKTFSQALSNAFETSKNTPRTS